MIQQLGRALGPLANKVTGMLLRGVIKAIDDSKGIQVIKVSALAGEVRDGIERLQPYGFTSVPKEGGEVLLLAIGGTRERMVALGGESRAVRLRDLLAGESAQYNDQGLRVHLKQDGTIVIGLEDADDPVVRKSDLEALCATFNGHTHSGTTLTANTSTGVITGNTGAGPSHTATASETVMVD